MRRRLSSNQLVETLGYIWPFLRPETRLLFYAAAAALGLIAAEVTAPILVGFYIDSLLAELAGRPPATSAILDRREIVAALVALALVGGLLLAVQHALAGKVGQQVSAGMRNRLWEQLQKLPLNYTRRRGPGRLLLRLNADTRAVQRLVSDGIVQTSQDLLLTVGIFGILIFLNWRMGLAVMLIVPVYYLIFRYLNPRLQKTSRDFRNRRTRLSGYLNARIEGMKVVKARGDQRAEMKRVKKINRQVAKHGSRREAADGWLRGLSVATVAVASALVLGLAAGEIMAGRLTGGQLVAFYTLAGLLGPIGRRIALADSYFQEAQISIERLSNTLSEEPEHSTDEDPPPLQVEEGAVIFDRVSFDYPDGTRVLREVNLEVRRGELVALVGPTGSGKSTLLQLLSRFREPTAGRIMIDGQEIGNVSPGSLRSQVGMVEQDAVVFEGTVEENVSYGLKADLSDEKVQRATRLAGVDELVNEMPEGWETKIRDGKRELSHGERRRIALARALATDPPILALDEISSSVDLATQRELASALGNLAREKTIIAATHSVPMIQSADRVYRLENGCAVEEKDMSTLLERYGGFESSRSGVHNPAGR